MDHQRRDDVVVGITLTRLGYHAILRWIECVATELRAVPSALFGCHPTETQDSAWESALLDRMAART
jgi:hypothetical protein